MSTPGLLLDVFFPPSVTFVLDFTELPSPMGLALYFQVDLSPKRLDGFLSNRTDCISPNRPWLHWLLHEAVFNDVHVLMLGRQAFHYPFCCNSITIRKIINSKLIFLPNSQLGQIPCHPTGTWQICENQYKSDRGREKNHPVAGQGSTRSQNSCQIEVSSRNGRDISSSVYGTTRCPQL